MNSLLAPFSQYGNAVGVTFFASTAYFGVRQCRAKHFSCKVSARQQRFSIETQEET